MRKHTELCTKRHNMEDRCKMACPTISCLSSILHIGSSNMSFHFVNTTKPKRPINLQFIHGIYEMGMDMIGFPCLQIHPPYCCTNTFVFKPQANVMQCHKTTKTRKLKSRARLTTKRYNNSSGCHQAKEK